MVRRALTRQTRWYHDRGSTFKNKYFIVEKPFWKILEFWPLETSILTWVKKWPKWFLNDFSRAFERCLSFFSMATRSRDHGGGAFKRPPPPSRRWKIQRPSRARVNLLPAGGHFAPQPLWFFDDNSKTKGSSVTKFCIPFHWSILHLLWFFCLGHIRSGHQVESRDLTSKKVYARATATVLNLRPAGGCLNTPLRFFADSKKTAARSAAGFSPTLSPIFLATFVKVSILCHARSGHQVRSSDHTLQKNYNRAPASVRGKVMKLSECDKVIGTYKMYLLNFLYRWP